MRVRRLPPVVNLNLKWLSVVAIHRHLSDSSRVEWKLQALFITSVLALVKLVLILIRVNDLVVEGLFLFILLIFKIRHCLSGFHALLVIVVLTIITL